MSETQMLQCKHCSYVFPSTHSHECSYDQLKKKNEKLREALKFYANEAIYGPKPFFSNTYIDEVRGTIARQALEGEQ